MQLTLDDLQTAEGIRTITADTFPIRYAARANPGVWVESTHELANTPGLEAACYREPTQNPVHEWDQAGIFVEVVKCATTRKYIAFCESYGPNQYRRQHNNHFEAATLAEAKRLATEWIETSARPWVAKELANQVDYVQVIDAEGTAHNGELWGVASGDRQNMRCAWVKLSDPEAFEGNGVRDGKVWIEWARIRPV